MSTTSVLSVRLQEDITARLEQLSASAGRPAAFSVRAAVEENLAELECTIY